MKFRKKPVVIEAYRTSDLIKSAREDWESLPQCIVEAYEKGEVVFGDSIINICTLEGVMTADAADWVIRGVKGELYPCKPDIFDATYENADAPALDFKDRVRAEKSDLDAKREKLLEFMKTERFVALTEAEQERLVKQYDVMGLYLRILRERIAAFG